MNGLNRDFSYLFHEVAMRAQIQKTRWTEHEAALRAVRDTVFIREQRVPPELEWDEHDSASVHFLAALPDGTAVGCVRLMASGQISRLSVLSDYRNHGIGKALVCAAEDEARQQGRDEIFLHAQTHATSFYESLGFSVTGGIFLEANIPHRQMFKILD